MPSSNNVLPFQHKAQTAESIGRKVNRLWNNLSVLITPEARSIAEKIFTDWELHGALTPKQESYLTHLLNHIETTQTT